jgi:hypothetical protein
MASCELDLPIEGLRLGRNGALEIPWGWRNRLSWLRGEVRN